MKMFNATGRVLHKGESRLLSIVNEEQPRRFSKYMLDEQEFLSPYGCGRTFAPSDQHLCSRCRRPASRESTLPKKLQGDPYWCDSVLFYKYFHSDSGAGLGANHQTGWTGLVTKLVRQSPKWKDS